MFYDWLKQSKSLRQKKDEYLLGFIKQFCLESGCVYGYRKTYKDMRVIGEQCIRNRVRYLMCKVGLVSQLGYERHNQYTLGELSTVIDNILDRQFAVNKPNWV